jgi:hypothetical protein
LTKIAGNWSEIKEEMMKSNVIQRDNVILAKKLHPALEEVAKENDLNVRLIILENE